MRADSNLRLAQVASVMSILLALYACSSDDNSHQNAPPIGSGGATSTTAIASTTHTTATNSSSTAGDMCSNGMKDGSESDVDCGGSCMTKCKDGKACTTDTDCSGLNCVNMKCAAPSCSDMKKDGDETDTDCGGSCTGSKCGLNKQCLADNDCSNDNCLNKVCQNPTCTDGKQNQQETDLDCGGPNCDNAIPPVLCTPGHKCVANADCDSKSCLDADAGTTGTCDDSTCKDMIQNNTGVNAETDVDCGGATCPKCKLGKGCKLGSDCDSGTCSGGICSCPTGMLGVAVGATATGFCIDTQEVTKDAYAAFIMQIPDVTQQAPECQFNMNYTPHANWPAPSGFGSYPVTDVDWCQATGYCAKEGKHLCGGIRLDVPDGQDFALNDVDQDEWFDACTSKGQFQYPYGSQTYVAGRCVDQNFGAPQPPPTGPLPASNATLCVGGIPELLSMSGNVAEWVDHCDATTGSTDLCVARGGAWDDTDGNNLSCEVQPSFDRGYSADDLGFRCCL